MLRRGELKCPTPDEARTLNERIGEEIERNRRVRQEEVARENLRREYARQQREYELKQKQEAKRKAEEEKREAARLKEQERLAEIARKKQEAIDAQHRAEEARKLAAEAEAKRKAEIEAKKKADVEAKQAEEALLKTLQAGKDRQRTIDAEAKRNAEAVAKQKADEAKRLAVETEAKRKAEEAAKKAAVDEARRKAETEAKRKADEAKRAEDDLLKSLRAEKDRQRAAETEAKRKAEAEAKQKADETKRLAVEAEAKRETEAEAKRKADEVVKRGEDELLKNFRAEKDRHQAEQKKQEDDASVRKTLYPVGSKLSSEVEKFRERNIVAATRPIPDSLSKETVDRREGAITRISDAVGVKDIRDPKELARLALDRTMKQVKPDLYSRIQDAKNLANDSAVLAKSLKAGKIDSEAQKVLQDNGLKLADLIIKEKGIKDIDVGKLKSVADVTSQTGTYLEQLNEKYAVTNAKAQAYRDLSVASDNALRALQRVRTANTPQEKRAAKSAFEEAKKEIGYKKRFVDLAEGNEKNVKVDPTPLITSVGKLSEQALEPHLDPYSKAALAISKEATRDLTTMAFKIETTNTVTRADTKLANAIQSALDAKKIRDNTAPGAQRVIADEKFEAAMKAVRASQQEAETARAVDYMTRVVPEDSVLGTMADIVAPRQMIQYERNKR